MRSTALQPPPPTPTTLILAKDSNCPEKFTLWFILILLKINLIRLNGLFAALSQIYAHLVEAISSSITCAFLRKQAAQKSLHRFPIKTASRAFTTTTAGPRSR
jgi:hypothetical protein